MGSTLVARVQQRWTTLKMAVFAPIPSASESSATRVKPGVFRSIRRPYRRSFGMLDGPCIKAANEHMAHSQ